MYCIVGFKILYIIDIDVLLSVLLAYVLSGYFQMILSEMNVYKGSVAVINACGELPDRATMPVLRVFSAETTSLGLSGYLRNCPGIFLYNPDLPSGISGISSPANNSYLCVTNPQGHEQSYFAACTYPFDDEGGKTLFQTLQQPAGGR
ncbi:MAG: hypothetical protein ACLSGF_12330 [Alistipes onderdonkii]